MKVNVVSDFHQLYVLEIDLSIIFRNCEVNYQRLRNVTLPRKYNLGLNRNVQLNSFANRFQFHILIKLCGTSKKAFNFRNFITALLLSLFILFFKEQFYLFVCLFNKFSIPYKLNYNNIFAKSFPVNLKRF